MLRFRELNALSKVIWSWGGGEGVGTQIWTQLSSKPKPKPYQMLFFPPEIQSQIPCCLLDTSINMLPRATNSTHPSLIGPIPLRPPRLDNLESSGCGTVALSSFKWLSLAVFLCPFYVALTHPDQWTVATATQVAQPPDTPTGRKEMGVWTEKSESQSHFCPFQARGSWPICHTYSSPTGRSWGLGIMHVKCTMRCRHIRESH